MLENLLKSVLAGFKQKNPKIWLIVAALLTAAKSALEALIGAGIVPDSASWTDWVFWIIALLLGSGGVAAYQFRNELNKQSSAQNLSTPAEKIVALENENKKLRELLDKA